LTRGSPAVQRTELVEDFLLHAVVEAIVEARERT
jgi:hypothetical protein